MALFYNFIGQIILYGGGAATVAFLIFRFLGKSWLESVFATRLENYKHQQAVEIERLRLQINEMLSGAIKLQEKEFVVLPEAWEKLDEARGILQAYTSSFQWDHDINRLTDQQLEDFFVNHWLSNSQKDEIRGANNKNATYQEFHFWHVTAKVKYAISSLQIVIAKNGIFFPQDIKTKMDQIVRIYIQAFIEHQNFHRYPTPEHPNQAFQAINEKAEPLYLEIESLISQRLHSHAVASASPQQGEPTSQN